VTEIGYGKAPAHKREAAILGLHQLRIDAALRPQCGINTLQIRGILAQPSHLRMRSRYLARESDRGKMSLLAVVDWAFSHFDADIDARVLLVLPSAGPKVSILSECSLRAQNAVQGGACEGRGTPSAKPVSTVIRTSVWHSGGVGDPHRTGGLAQAGSQTLHTIPCQSSTNLVEIRDSGD
jgi:hypothetical protein